MQLDPKVIRVDGGTQPRAELLIEVMEDYAEQMRNGVEFPPITVFFDGKDYWLVDGFHRLGAHQRARPKDLIEAEVIQGTQSQAQWHSLGANKTHGLRRRREDRRRAVKAALRHPEGASRSDNEIAEHVGVSHSTVAKYRLELESSCQIGKMRTRNVTRQGSSFQQNTAQIGGKGKKRRSNDTPSHRMAARIAQPTRTPKPMAKMTALSMPHDPFMGAMTLIEVFDADYLRALIETLSSHLKELSK